LAATRSHTSRSAACRACSSATASCARQRAGGGRCTHRRGPRGVVGAQRRRGAQRVRGRAQHARQRRVERPVALGVLRGARQ
jgi:hypothetical protein